MNREEAHSTVVICALASKYARQTVNVVSENAMSASSATTKCWGKSEALVQPAVTYPLAIDTHADFSEFRDVLERQAGSKVNSLHAYKQSRTRTSSR